MIEVRDVSYKSLHEKLKGKKIKKIVEEFFPNDSFEITLPGFSVFFIKKKEPIKKHSKESKLEDFLTIIGDSGVFVLKKEEYFYKTYEFAKRYEQLLGGNVILNLDYLKPKEDRLPR